MLGKSLGSTNFVLVDPTGQCTVVDVNVSMDTVAVAATLHELMPNETRIRVSAAADSIVLSGVVSDGPAVERAMDIAMSFTRKAGDTSSKSAQARIVNLLSVTSPQQVMLEVKVAEVDKTILDQFGIDFTRAYASGDGSMMRFLSGVFGGAGLLGLTVSGATGATVGAGAVGTQTNGLATTAGSAPNGNSVSGSPPTIPLVNGKSFTSLTGNMQRQDALVKVLAEPNVMAISGQEGSFLAGGKILIPITQAANGLTTITLQEMEYGVSLRFTPTVLADGRINLKVNPEVSELSATGTAVSAGSTTSVLPTFTTRRVQTTVQLMDGQSFAIGGLISNNVTSSIQAFPFLADIPIIGALFRSTSFQGDRSELVIVITPRLVKPLGPQFPLPTDAYVPPSRTDLILNGKLEGKNPADAIGGSDDHHHVLDPVSPTK